MRHLGDESEDMGAGFGFSHLIEHRKSSHSMRRDDIPYHRFLITALPSQSYMPVVNPQYVCRFSTFSSFTAAFRGDFCCLCEAKKIFF